nr:zinc finger protein 407 [Paramormyrops kingsleyae]XP_023668391.1 zinc finger protein 407 [Paramormyrops kingsleyae]
MDNSKNKRKLRSGKEVADDKVVHEDEGNGSSVKQGCDVRSEAKRPRTSNATDEDKTPGEPCPAPAVEATATTRDGQQPDSGPTSDCSCECTVCDFVAKTPTALKVHTTRKHSRKGAGLRGDGSRRGKANQNTEQEGHIQSAVSLDPSNNESIQQCCFKANSTNQIDRHVKETHQESPSGETETEAEKNVTVKLSKNSEMARRESHHNDGDDLPLAGSKTDCGPEGPSPAPGTKVGLNNKSEQDNRVSPTRMLLEMVDNNVEKTHMGKEAENETMEELESIKASDGSSQKRNQGLVKGLKAATDSEIDIDPTEKSANVDAAGGTPGSIQAGKEAPTVPIAQGQVHSKVVKRGLKPKTQNTCSYCGQLFPDRPSLAIHVKRQHAKESNFLCKVCLYSCATKSEYEKHCCSSRHKRLVSEKTGTQGALALVASSAKQQNVHEIEFHAHGEGSKSSATRLAAAQLLKRSANARVQLQCKACAYKTYSSTLLLRHERLKHSKEIRFHCKPCGYYASTSEGMEKHLARKKHQQSARRENLGASFDECVEKVCLKLSEIQPPPNEIPDTSKDLTNDEDNLDGQTNEATGAEGSAEVIDQKSLPKKRRGRPKGSTVTTCDYCGLIASNATNLSVHIRRRHSHQYSFGCKLCSYYCVTKGDMDRHCATKKHMKRMEEANADNPEDNQVDPSSVVEVLNNGQPSQAKTSGDYPGEGEAMQATQGSLDEAAIASGQLSHSEDGQESESGQVVSVLGNACQELDGSAQKKSKYDSVNSCAHCDFVAHSLPSLDLHIKRKHTKDFEFVCKACSYYAVTRREMTRHATTEKHKQKSQSYLESLRKNESRPSQANKEAENEGEPKLESNDIPFTESSQVDETVSDQKTNAGKCQSGEMSESVASVPNVAREATGSAEPYTIDAVVSEKAVKSQGNLETINNEGHSALDENSKDVELSRGESPAPSKDIPLTKPAGEPVEDSALESEELPEDDLPEGGTETEDDCLVESLSDADPDYADRREDGSLSVKQLVRAVPFDASIVSAKAFLELEPSALDETHATRTSSAGNSAGNSSPLSGKKNSGLRSKGSTSSRIRCEDCGFLADGLSGLNVHIAMKHPSKEKHFHCLLCGKSFYTESNLHQHLTSAAHLRNEQASIEELPEGGASFKCVKCTEPFETEQDLFMHIKEKHEELLREVNKYVLEDTEQINKEREENQGNVCKYCGKVCKSSNSMAFLAHVRTHTGSKPFKCKICNFATAQLGDARNHVKRHLGMREYKCHVCGWAFVMKKHLSTHLLGKHGVGRPKERKFECDLCDRSFSERWALKNHCKLHTGEKPYKCEWPSCHYSFLTLSALKDHGRTHTGEKSFLCDLCGFAGGTRHALTKHRRQHTGEKPFRCQLCNFASTTQSHLTRHRRVHTGEKPYHCPWCDYRSNCAENIRKHILHTGKHEGVKMYNCPKCDYGTNAPMDFRNHLKEMHPDIENPDLAYLHAGIVSKSFECRLKGQGATFVETETAFAADEASQGTRHVGVARAGEEAGAVQQVIIIQGYGGELAVDSSLEESAAAALQTLAEVLHITEDGQVITGGTTAAASGHHHGTAATQYVLVESGESELAEGAATSTSPSTLDALLCAVTELGGAEQRGGGAQPEVSPKDDKDYESRPATGGEEHSEEVEQQTAVEVYGEVLEEQTGEPVEVVTQVVGSAVGVPGPQDVVQEVLQFAATQLMMKEGLTQVIVNDQGTHFIVTELEDGALQVEGAVYGTGAEAAPVESVVVYSNSTSQDTIMEE